MTITYVVSVGLADVRRGPDPASELVTQALMNRSANVDEFVDEWAHVTLSDYTGWIRTSELEDSIALGGGQSTHPYHDTPSQAQRIMVGVPLAGTLGTGYPGPSVRAYHDMPSQAQQVMVGVAPCGYPGPSAKIAVTHTPLYISAQGEETLGNVYLSTILPLLDISQQERLQVALPGGRTAWLERSAASVHQPERASHPRTPVSTITAYARTFLGVPYLWGGTSWEGIDCSGLVQLCYRMGGYIIPRDADQQHDFLDHCVARGVMQEGDLIFFGRKSITHVAMALNNHEYIHAEGDAYNYVTINSFDPAARNYNANLDKLMWAIKRVIV